MNLLELIERKQADPKSPLRSQDIQDLIQDYTQDAIPDYQMSAFLMLVYFLGLSSEEVTDLTLAMAASGDQLDLSSIHGRIVDKHSTGGVGDTTTLVLAPLLAACGVPVAKMSGRGLGHTGGTVDKFEAIPGFQVELSESDFIRQVNEIGVAVTGQTGNIAPADKKIYALRDVTGTVQSIPLIASSIMSKKLAAGADAIVLDVKVGNGAFMTDLADARELAQTMIAIGQGAGRQTQVVISDMNQPLGWAVGNILEIKEALATLKNQGPQDLRNLCLTLGSQMLLVSGKVDNRDQARQLLEEKLADGSAFHKLVELVQAQGGDVSYLEEPERFGQAEEILPLLAPQSGVLATWQAHQVGEAARLLGAGRLTKESVIDPQVGIEIHQKIGDPVQAGQTVLATLHSNDPQKTQAALEVLQDSFTIQTAGEVQAPPLIYEIIED